LITLAVLSLAGALAIGVVGAVTVSAWFVPFVAGGAVLVPAYNLELWGGRLHNDWMFAAAWGMWNLKYWAVLGFQALLGLSVITASLSLLVASNVEAVVRSLVVIAAAGTLFWFLIRAMARLQMPSRTR
jgi:hypothetical protein